MWGSHFMKASWLWRVEMAFSAGMEGGRELVNLMVVVVLKKAW